MGCMTQNMLSLWSSIALADEAFASGQGRLGLELGGPCIFGAEGHRDEAL